jgi:hypothetical protein
VASIYDNTPQHQPTGQHQTCTKWKNSSEIQPGLVQIENLFQKFRMHTTSLFGSLVADGWCWFVLREKYCWLVAGGWFVLREKYCWLVADKPSEQAAQSRRQQKSTEHNRCV